MIKTISILLITLLFQGCVGIGRTYYSPEVDAIVLDMETLEPIQNVHVRDLQIMGRSELRDVVIDTSKSITTKDGCLNIPGYYKFGFFLFPAVGTSRMWSGLYILHPDYQEKPVLIKTHFDTDHETEIILLCKKSSTKCKSANVLYENHLDDGHYVYDYESDDSNFKGADGRSSYEEREAYEKKFKQEIGELKFKQEYIDRCIK